MLFILGTIYVSFGVVDKRQLPNVDYMQITKTPELRFHAFLQQLAVMLQQ
jgi:hypothetical protein